MTEHYIILILSILIFISFILGYILGKINTQINPMLNGVSDTKSISFFKQQEKQSTKQQYNIDINDKKVVVPIKTEDLQKKYNTFGETSQSQENITTSINKLKSMKG